ncbi:MAG: DUF480 domain-containing protein [Planctomycetota bacterium]|jgi:uncharacterized protein YceH (UPF0502 family)
MSEIADDAAELAPIREFSHAQRRVLGVLLEKAFTTPEYYPLTLKAVMTGCNQKSNRSPIVSYDEDRVEDILHELKELGLVGELHPDSGRSLRYRHYMRKRFEFTEPQLAILTELLLRGRQTLGELRGRASRMVPIDDLETLRSELQGLLDQGCLQASGSLERRGVEVDHGFYQAGESAAMPTMPAAVASTAAVESPSESQASASAVSTVEVTELESLRSNVGELRQQNQELRSDVESLKAQLSDLERRMDDLCRDLGA